MWKAFSALCAPVPMLLRRHQDPISAQSLQGHTLLCFTAEIHFGDLYPSSDSYHKNWLCRNATEPVLQAPHIRGLVRSESPARPHSHAGHHSGPHHRRVRAATVGAMGWGCQVGARRQHQRQVRRVGHLRISTAGYCSIPVRAALLCMTAQQPGVQAQNTSPRPWNQVQDCRWFSGPRRRLPDRVWKRTRLCLSVVIACTLIQAGTAPASALTNAPNRANPLLPDPGIAFAPPSSAHLDPCRDGSHEHADRRAGCDRQVVPPMLHADV